MQPSSRWLMLKASLKSMDCSTRPSCRNCAEREVHAGPFTIEPIRVTHSLVDCVALAIETPAGVVIHTGDFKIDLSPLDAHAFDLHTFAEYGKRGVGAAAGFNQCRAIRLHAERTRGDPRLDEVFSQTKKKLFFTCFSSSIYACASRWSWRASTAARSHYRRSMMESSEIAQDLGYIEIPPGLVIQPGQMRDYAPIIDDPDQRHAGEPMSALSRPQSTTITRAHRCRDTVVLSSRIIPGNEKASSASSTIFAGASHRDLR